jgi:hypothetical protein
MLQGGMNFLSGTGYKPLPMLPPPAPAAASTAVAAAALGEAGSSSMHAAQYAASQHRPLPLHRTSPGSYEDVAAAASAAAGAGGAVEPAADANDLQQFLRENPDEAKQLRLKMMKKRNAQG